MEKTYEEINNRIKAGEAVIVTAEEMVDIVKSKGAEEAARPPSHVQREPGRVEARRRDRLHNRGHGHGPEGRDRQARRLPRARGARHALERRYPAPRCRPVLRALPRGWLATSSPTSRRKS